MLNLSLYATLGEPTKASVSQWVGFRATAGLSRLCLNCATMVSVGRRYTRLRKRSTLNRRAPHGPVVPSLRRSAPTMSLTARNVIGPECAFSISRIAS